MRYGWLSVSVLAAAIALAGCNRGGADPAPADPAAAQREQAAKQAAAEGKAFLERNAKAEGVTVLPSGLQYKVVKAGPATGPRAADGDEVKVHYVGTLVDGTQFESTHEMGQPAVFRVGELVPGFNEALRLMRPGDVWYIYIPPELGYGDRDTGGPIPPNSVLVFKLEMLEILPAGGATSLG